MVLNEYYTTIQMLSYTSSLKDKATHTIEQVILLSTPFPLRRKLQRKKKKFRRIKKGKAPAKLKGREQNEPYFTCWGLIIQEDVSILSVCETNNRCRKIQRLRSMMTSINESSSSMYKKNSSIRRKLKHKGRNQHKYVTK
jgi:hypothetical protein